ncbi:gp88 [uncultured Mediterranean phage uvMED]|nr:gp88 [uncultured Mediterranean phage uvMED]
MARLIGNVDATGSLTTAVSAPATNASAVSLYLPFDSTVNDASANGHSVTASGNAAISNSQAKFGSYSLLLDGTGDYLTISDDASLEFGSGDLTIEAFFYENDNTGHMIVQKRAANGGWSSGTWLLSVNAAVESDADDAGKIQFWAWDYNTTANLLQFDNGAALSSGWHHLCVTRSADSWHLFLDGRQVDTDTWSGSIGNASHPVTIGRDTYAGRDRYYANCFIDDLRITKGIALYTQNFVPPSQAVGASLSGANETNSTTDFTSLYLPFDSSVTADGSPINHSITANGGVNISNTQAKFGSYSAAFDGSDDQLTFTYNTGQYFGTGDFSFECFIYISAYPSGYWPIIYLGGPGATGNYQPSFGLGFENSGGKLRSIVGGTYIDHNSVTINTGQWIHVAACRAGGVYRTFINGQLHGSTANTSNVTAGSSNSAIGGANFGGGAGTFYAANGFIDDVRVLNGFGKYTAPFTPPTSAVTATVSQTRNDLAVLYLPFNDGLEDKARNHPVTANGNAAVSATQAKFGGKSLALDGSGDYLSVSEVPALSQNPFTIQAFVYPSVVNTYQTLFDSRVNNSTNGGMTVQITNSAKIQVYAVTSSGTVNFTTSASLSANSWQHIALVRSGTGSNETQIFIDGVSAGTFTLAGNLSLSSFNIGKTFDNYYLNGFIDDYRITSFAEYSANFTPPTSALSSEVSGTTTDTRTFSSVWNLNSPEVAEAFKAGTWPS